MQYAKPVTLNVDDCDRRPYLPFLFRHDFLFADSLSVRCPLYPSAAADDPH